jgi:alpha-tubulin suppressor-like RCC1 family protein
LLGLKQFGTCDVPNTLINAVIVRCGRTHVAALTREGSVICWGHNGRFEVCTPPPDLIHTRHVSCGDHFSCALTEDGKLIFWGAGRERLNSTSNELDSVVAVACGAQHVIAVLATGQVKTVVSGTYQGPGQLIMVAPVELQVMICGNILL